MHSENEVVYLYLDDIIPNRFQPREVFDDRALQELAMSIKEHGVIQPIIVRSIGDKYEIIAGERRYKASALAGLTKIPAIIRNLDDKESSKVALLENLQRKDLNAIEEARTYQKILELDQMTQEELARTMGKSQPAVANKLRLLTLPEEVQDALLKEKISERHARSLLALDRADQQIQMMNEVINERMTVRELDSRIKALKNPQEGTDTSNVRSYNPLDNPSKPRFILDPLPEETQNEETKEPVIPSQSENIQEEKPLADLDYLLNLDVKKQEPKMSMAEQLEQELAKSPAEDLILPTKTEPQPTEKSTPEIEELLDVEDSPPQPEVLPNRYDLKTAIGQTRELIKNMEKNGLVINTEEMDFENVYQITIKIDKNK